MSRKRLYVLVGLERGADGHARVTKYGPTSESAGLLHGYVMRWPSRTDRTAVLPVLRGALLRVSQSAADRALR